jgi:hypothetical protein
MYIIIDDKRCLIVSYHSTQNRILIADSGKKVLLNWFYPIDMGGSIHWFAG